jgi:Polyketide cyclase / dehydrase and lipid transport
MARDGFTLVTDWQVEGTIEEVAAILSEPERFPEWWPEVYLSVEEVAAGGPDGVGRTVALHTRGWLPYTLRWTGRLVESHRPHGWTVEATGDLTGRGAWRLEQRGDITEVHYDWRVRVDKPVLRALAPLLRPAYAANHRWAMARGLEGLTRELLRRRAVARMTSGAQRASR